MAMRVIAYSRIRLCRVTKAYEMCVFSDEYSRGNTNTQHRTTRKARSRSDEAAELENMSRKLRLTQPRIYLNWADVTAVLDL